MTGGIDLHLLNRGASSRPPPPGAHTLVGDARDPASVRAAIGSLDFDYDSSYPDTDPYEPQPGGCCSWLPFELGNVIELPITLPQDHALFTILRHTDARMWLEKARRVRERGGMVLALTHPDYQPDDRQRRERPGAEHATHCEGDPRPQRQPLHVQEQGVHQYECEAGKPHVLVELDERVRAERPRTRLEVRDERKLHHDQGIRQQAERDADLDNRRAVVRDGIDDRGHDSRQEQDGEIDREPPNASKVHHRPSSSRIHGRTTPSVSRTSTVPTPPTNAAVPRKSRVVNSPVA